MPRAHRHFLPGHVWHITHRCHKSEFLLRFAPDRERYRFWLYQARRRFGLCVLDYVVTSNHVHLLVKDTKPNAIARGMQLVAGRTGQEFNLRKERKGAFWEDRYHATAIQQDEHLRRCLIYIDLNMVRAGVVDHPARWPNSGYVEIQSPRSRYCLIDHRALRELFGFERDEDFRERHREWVEDALRARMSSHEPYWSASLAVGDQHFVDYVKAELGVRGRGRHVGKASPDTNVLQEPVPAYRVDFDHRIDLLRPENTLFWSEDL